ncbi:MAG: hypothetical protein IT184_01505 [Acidobacteria bacterium]|nr:hypothetical protein [Acidobacteriota bacterium]
MTSKVLPRLLSALAPVEGPTLLNLGPVIGQNIAFFGDRLACRISIEDLFVPIDEQATGRLSVSLADTFETRLPTEPAVFDGILCWDVFDFLDKPTSQRLASRLVTLLRPGGVLYGFFGTQATDVSQHTRFIVEAPDALRLRPAPAPTLKRHVLVNRDLNKIFEGLSVAESILLKTATRETLFRKAA